MKCIHDFKKDLKFSHSCSDKPYWEEIYKKAFPTFKSMTDLRESGEHQYKGIDRVIVLQNSKVIYVDEKVRRKNYEDIALEYISNNRTKSDGWVCKDLFCDYIAYAIEDIKKCYLLPTIQLQSAWSNKKEKWLKFYGTKYADNGYYQTLFCPVPIDVLFREIGQCLRVDFKQ